MPPEPTTVQHLTMTCTGTSEYMDTVAEWRFTDPGRMLHLRLVSDMDNEPLAVQEACTVYSVELGDMGVHSSRVDLQHHVRKAHHVALMRYIAAAVQVINGHNRSENNY
jgi:hypothetical protein